MTGLVSVTVLDLRYLCGWSSTISCLHWSLPDETRSLP